MSSQNESGSDNPTCFKCGQEVEMDDWKETDFPEPLCYGCDHGEREIQGHE